MVIFKRENSLFRNSSFNILKIFHEVCERFALVFLEAEEWN